jgi:hypothetical protein
MAGNTFPLRCHCLTIVPAMSLAEALKTTRLPRVAGRTGARTALVTTRPCRAPHHTISEVGLIEGPGCRCQARCRWPTRGSCSWMSGRRADGTCSKGCASRSSDVLPVFSLVTGSLSPDPHSA